MISLVLDVVATIQMYDKMKNLQRSAGGVGRTGEDYWEIGVVGLFC